MDKLSVSHSCGDSALKCVDCSGQVCPKCFVQCAVGNRCKKCASRFTSHILKTPPTVLIRLCLAMMALGIGYGYLEHFIFNAGFGFYGYVVQFFIWFALGKVMHRVAAYKQGPKILAAAVVGLLLGLAIGPFREIIISTMSITSSVPSDAEGYEYARYAGGEHLISAAIMFFGVLSPFFRKG